MYQDYKDHLSAFHAHGVKYLIVGGYAVIFHAQPRFTKDIDLFIKADLPLEHRLKAFVQRNSWTRAATDSRSCRCGRHPCGVPEYRTSSAQEALGSSASRSQSVSPLGVL